MPFFIPFAKDAEEAENVLSSIRQNLASQGSKTNDRRIRRITFRHDGKPEQAEVGKKFESTREIVIAILQDENQQLYYVCTPNRGVVRGGPYLVGAHADTVATDFRNDDGAYGADARLGEN